MTDLWQGIDIPVIGVTGPKASGKTVFASTINPQETLYIDAEMSTASYGGIPYKKRVDLFAELEASGTLEPTAEETFLAWKSIVDAIQPGEYRVIVTDPWDFIQHGLHAWIEKHPEKFNKTAGQYAKASMMVWGDVKTWLHTYTAMVCRRLNHGSMVFINHEGDEFKGGSATGKKKTKGVDTIYQLASLYLNFERKPDQKGKIPAVPAAYTCESRRGKSRLMHVEMHDGELLTKPILPARIPLCTPKAIREYIAQPADFERPKKGELAPDEVLSDDEKLLLQQNIAANQLEQEQLKLARLEGMRQAGAIAAEQAAKAPQPISRPAPPAVKPATSETTPATTAAQPPAESPAKPTTAEPAAVSPPATVAETAPFTADAPSTESPVTDTTKLDTYTALQQQQQELLTLGFTEAQFLQMVAKRQNAQGQPCQSIQDLTASDAEELRHKLAEFITKKKSAPASP